MPIEEPFAVSRKKREVVETKEENLTISESEDIDGIEVRNLLRIEINQERRQVLVDIRTEL